MWQVLFGYHSHDISFGDWVSLLTLSLAPLIAHIAAGVPSPTYLHTRQPCWHDRICHYNPTSILWRYLAIIDRRVRAKSWSTLDLAASNALFWDGYKWDGSEDMIQRSRDFCIRAPRHHHIDPLSMSTIVTIVVTLQGVQALHSLISGSNGSYSYTMAIDSIFFPLATLGLLRLPAALWLTNDYAYRHVEDLEIASPTDIGLKPNSAIQPSSALIMQPSTNSMETPVVPNRFHAHRGWRSIVIRGFYLIMVASLFGLCLFMFIGPPGATVFSATGVTLNLTFMFYLGATTGTVGTYVIRGRCHTTIIPCITALWYKIYTGILFSAMLTVFIVAAIETRKTPCGRYTTYTQSTGVDWAACGESTYVHQTAQYAANSTFVVDRQNGTALVPYKSLYLNNNVTYGMAMMAGKGEIMVVAFDGWCKVDSEITPLDITMYQPINFTITG